MHVPLEHQGRENIWVFFFVEAMMAKGRSSVKPGVGEPV
jgi:hypothetical protein